MAEYIANVVAQTSKLDWAFPFERKGQFPLDRSSVFSSLEDAKVYATGSATDSRKLGGTSYVGQIISVYEPEGEGTSATVNAYIITPQRGLMKLAATTASGDVTADIANLQGQVESLIQSLAENYHTKEEVVSLINEAKDSRVDDLVETVEDLQNAVGAPSGEGVEASGLYKAIEDEKIRALAAEEALGKRIDAIDYVDDTELATALESYAKIADVNTSLEQKVDVSTYTADKKELQDADTEIRKIAEGARDLLNTFLTSEEIDDTVNTLKEIQAELDKMTDATELETALAAKADNSVVEDIAGRVKAIEDAPYVTKNQLDTVDNKFVNYTTTEILTSLLAAKQDTIPENTYDSFGSADKAKQDAIADADLKLANKANVSDVYSKSQTYTKDEVDALIDTVTGGDTSETITSIKLQLDNYKKTINEEIWGNEEAIGDSRIDKLEAVGAQANVLEGVQVNGTDLVITNKKVNIDLSPYATAANLNIVNQLAGTAKQIAEDAKALAETNSGSVQSLDRRMEQAEKDIFANATVIGLHANDYATLKGRVDGHDQNIADLQNNKVNKTAVYTKEEINAITGDVAEGSTLVGMINTKANSSDVYLKTEVYSKAEAENKFATIEVVNNVSAKLGEIAEDKTVVDLIAAETARATAAEQANLAAIEAIYKAGEGDNAATGLLVEEINRAKAAEKANADEIARVNTVLAAAIENEDGVALNSIKELATWIEEHGAEAGDMTKAINANTAAIEKINHAEEGILAQSKAYTDTQLAGIPVATVDTLGLVKIDNNSIKMNESNQLYVAKVSTDVLEQGTQILVLNGGSATD